LVARRSSVRRDAEGDVTAETNTTRIGAVAMPLGVVVLVVSEILHPSREDPMDNPAVFAEYAQSDSWTAVHLLQWFGFLLLLGGLVALFYSLGPSTGAGSGLAPFGLAAAVTTAASFTVLQAVDGVALKRAVDAWESAPADEEAAAFAAAEAIRWTEIGMNAFSFFLLGLSLLLYGLALASGVAYPRWAGWVAVIAGAALMYHGAVVVAFEGFVASVVGLVGLLLMAILAFVMAVLMWLNASRGRVASSAR
jgi:hypothetical protein